MKHSTFWPDSKITRKPEDEGAGGNPDPNAGNGDPPADPPVDSNAGADPAPQGPDLSFLGKDYVKDGQLDADAFKERWESLVAQETRLAEQAPDIPEDGEYDLAVPDDLDFGDIELPEGVAIEPLDPSDETFAPVFEEAKAFLKENGIGQTAAKGLMGLVAKMEAAKEAKRYAEATEAYNTLGATDAARNARMASLQRAAQTRLPSDQAEALLSGMTSSPEAVRALEKLLGMNAGPRTSQNTATQVDPNLRGFDLLKAANAQAPS
ncbi:MAG: hypothetical protein RI571_06600 [Roseovarius sp.]|nr:hypothetical protein [Roseovarius sp.]